MRCIARISVVLIVSLLLSGCADREYRNGVESLENGKYEEAVGYLEKAVEREHNVGDSYRGIGIAKWELEDFEGAVVAFEAALENGAEESAAIYDLMGACKLNLKDPSSAISYYEKGIAQEGCTEEMAQEMKFNIIAAYEQLKDWESAQEKLAEYTAEYPEDAQAAKEAEFLETR